MKGRDTIKYIKYILPVLLIALSIGYAAINVTLSISGDAYIASDLDDFEVYISDIRVEGIQDLTLLKSTTEFQYAPNNLTQGANYYVTYEITNGSSKFDALVSIDCTESDSMYVSISSNTIDTDTALVSLQSRSGELEIFADGVSTEYINCKISATPIERNSFGDASNLNSEFLTKIMARLDVYQNTNITSAEKNLLDLSKKQVQFYEENAIVTEEDVITISEMYEKINNLSTVIKETEEEINRLTNLANLYTTETVTADDKETIEKIIADIEELLATNNITETERENLEATKDRLTELVETMSFTTFTDSNESGVIDEGDTVNFQGEKFNVIFSPYGEEYVYLLAQYNIGTNGRQTQEENYVKLIADENEPFDSLGDIIELDKTQYSTAANSLLTNYENYLKELLEVTELSSELMSLSDFENIECTIPTSETTTGTCSSEYTTSWLGNNQNWWIRNSIEAKYFYFSTNNIIATINTTEAMGIRPVIKMLKSDFNALTEVTIDYKDEIGIETVPGQD